MSRLKDYLEKIHDMEDEEPVNLEDNKKAIEKAFGKYGPVLIIKGRICFSGPPTKEEHEEIKFEWDVKEGYIFCVESGHDESVEDISDVMKFVKRGTIEEDE